MKERLAENDTQLNQIYDAMENLLSEKPPIKSGKKETELVLKKANNFTPNTH